SFVSLVVPLWLFWAFAGWRGMLQVWLAILVTGVFFAVPQFLISNFINPWIVDIGASLISMACLVLFLQVWSPREIWTSPALRRHDDHVDPALGHRRDARARLCGNRRALSLLRPRTSCSAIYTQSPRSSWASRPFS